MLNTRILIILLFISVTIFSYQISLANNIGEGRVVSPLANISWNVGEASRAILEDVDDAEIARFVNRLLGDVDNIGQIGEYKFIDLNNESKYQLVATIDYSGREFYNTVVIIRKLDDHFWYQKLSGFNVTNLEGIFSDLDSDRKKELLIENLFSLYRGPKPAARWTDIYKWDGTKYSKVSKLHPLFYAKKILELEKKIINAKDPLEQTALQIEMDKAKRLIDPNSKAGHETAVKLFNSANPDMKIDAIRIWEDMGDSESLIMLKNAEKNPNKRISEEALRAKERVLLPKDR